ncbi:MAG: hypothetical protein WCF67_08445, partial [Chitinophagaceae bacterium]
MKFTLCIAFAIFMIAAKAQDCNKELLLKKAGSWQEGQQGSIVNVSAEDLAREKMAVAAIHKMISANYTPMGCQVSYSKVFGKYPGEGQVFIADPYHYTLRILRYLCDAGSADKTKYY